MGPLGRADGLLVGREFVGAEGVAGEAVLDALDGHAGEDGAQDGALGLADVGDFGGEFQERAVAEDDAGRTVVGKFDAGEVAEPLEQLEDADDAVVAGEGEEVAFGELDLAVYESGEGTVEDGGRFAADGREERNCKVGGLLGEEAFTAGGEPKDVARPPGAFADPGEGDDALGL